MFVKIIPVLPVFGSKTLFRAILRFEVSGEKNCHQGGKNCDENLFHIKIFK
jgi:hypothetical protein